MSSSRTLSRKRRTSFTCIKPRFGPSIILLYIAASVEQYCDITQVNALPENEGILEHVPKTEDGIGRAFPTTVQGIPRYCHTTGVWFFWTGTQWRKDETQRVFNWSRGLCRHNNS